MNCWQARQILFTSVDLSTYASAVRTCMSVADSAVVSTHARAAGLSQAEPRVTNTPSAAPC